MRRADINKLLRAKRCDLWPHCGCANLWHFWQEKADDEETTYSIDQLAAIETGLFSILACASVHAPDRRVRESALRQLASPYWDRQRRGEEVTEEIVEEVRRRLAAS